MQQFREAIPANHWYRFVIHDWHWSFSDELDQAVQAMGVRVLETPVRAPQANSFCERLIGMIRREGLDFVMPLNEKHLRRILKEWVNHYNKGRPHSSLGPGRPEPAAGVSIRCISGYRIPDYHRVLDKSVLGGLHHEYRLERVAA